MNKTSAENLVSQAFNYPFNQSKYSELISNIFKVSVKSELNAIPISEKFKDIVSNIKIYSNYSDTKSKKIDALEIELRDNVSFNKSRYIQRNIATDYLKKNNCDAVLISFYNKKGLDWRLSLITREVNSHIDKKGNIKVQINTSPIKRLSYLVGQNEPNFTAKTQVINLLLNKNNTLDDIKNAFNLEKVTNEFFEDYKKHYLNLSEEIDKMIKNDIKIKNDFREKNINSENFSKKLLGQIVFLYFLQKKGWLGIKKNENGNFQKWGSGSKTFLHDLYNDYKNKKIKAKNFFNDLLEPIFYDALNNEEEYYDKLDCKIPFLNGGLFKPFNEYNWTETDININDQVFEDIFKTFNQYNFTVQEDQNFDADVAVDPEMLGKVFERLLPENFKKGKGSYYTPREVVSYMCKQSIKNYLLKFDDLQKKEGELEQFLLIDLQDDVDIHSVEKIFSTNEFKILDKCLEDIKICDPAIGSGAFPVQLMNEIVNLRMIISQLLKLNYSEYKIKRNFIENSIYGVDIDSSAIEIAKLRLWLSLIIDEKSFETIEPLPNLDYKILQGNSLIQKYKNFDFENDKKNELFVDDDFENLKKELISIQHEYFNTSSRKKSKKLQEELNNKINNLISIKTNTKNNNQNFLSLIEDKNFFFWRIFFIDVFENGGFDIVIGNPPYVFARSSVSKGFSNEDKKHYEENYKLSEYQLNTYSLFIELGSKILKENGVLSFIIPNNWMTINSNLDLRKFILQKKDICIVNFSEKVFKNADVDVAILMFINENQEENSISVFRQVNNNIILSAKNKANILYDDEFDYIINFDVIEDPKLKTIAKKISSVSSALTYFSKVKSGLKAYEKGKGIPPQTKEMIKNRVYHSNKKIDKNYIKYLDGDDVKRYEYTWNKQYLKYGKNLAGPRTSNLFSSKRILVRQIPSKPPYCVNSHLFTEEILNDLNSMNIIDFNYEPLVILGILNSKLISFWFIVRFAKLQRQLFPQFKVNELEKFPIPKIIDKLDREKIVSLVKKKIKKPNDKELDFEIDDKINKIFRINKDEKYYIDQYLKNFN